MRPLHRERVFVGENVETGFERKRLEECEHSCTAAQGDSVSATFRESERVFVWKGMSL